MKKIKLTRNKYAIVDDDMFENLKRWNWSCDAKGYAVRHELKDEYLERNRKMIKMHRYIMKVSDKEQIDHINRNTLDNRKCNLRIADAHLNQRNAKLSSRNTSGYKGVYWDKKYQRWCARTLFYGKSFFGGGYVNKEDAISSYERMTA